MALIPAKCTNCGANIKVDASKDAGICEHCETAFITEKVITNNITNVTNVTHVGSGAVINMQSKNKKAIKKLAEDAYERGDYKESYSYYTQCSELDEFDYESKFKRTLALAFLSSLKDYSKASTPIMMVEEYCNNVINDEYEDEKHVKINLAFYEIAQVFKALHETARNFYIENKNKTTKEKYYDYLKVIDECISSIIELLSIQSSFKSYIVNENIVYQTNLAFEILDCCAQNYVHNKYKQFKFYLVGKDKKALKTYIKTLLLYRKRIEPKFKLSKLKLKNI